ncbi:hypothetical protein ACGFIG_09155 [Micromonospora sp. NPDC049048]|uniref:hypothetical protein n=1 Tax=Micromonospora sp. NPDC049048 TaxID=3364263 RepID=UPI003722D191
MHTRNTAFATALTVIAVAAWLAIAVLPSHWRVTALAIAGAATVAAIVVTLRQVAVGSVRAVTTAVAAAPRDAYYRGYGDAAQDAFNPELGEPE